MDFQIIISCTELDDTDGADVTVDVIGIDQSEESCNMICNILMSLAHSINPNGIHGNA